MILNHRDPFDSNSAQTSQLHLIIIHSVGASGHFLYSQGTFDEVVFFLVFVRNQTFHQLSPQAPPPPPP